MPAARKPQTGEKAPAGEPKATKAPAAKKPTTKKPATRKPAARKPAASKPPAKPTEPQERPLAPMQVVFVREYLIDRNATQAAIRAGYSVANAAVLGFQLLKKPQVLAAIAKAEADLAKRCEITQEMVVRRFWDLATADPNELMQFRRTCCRFCHGEGHQYQWVDDAEFLQAVDAAAKAHRKMVRELGKDDDEPEFIPPSRAGGIGFNHLLSPHDDCPKCLGEGVPSIHIQDTRLLSDGGKALYAGLKQTKEGFEIKLHDQAKALENVARHLGMFKDKVEHDLSDPLAKLLGVSTGALKAQQTPHDDD